MIIFVLSGLAIGVISGFFISLFVVQSRRGMKHKGLFSFTYSKQEVEHGDDFILESGRQDHASKDFQ